MQLWFGMLLVCLPLTKSSLHLCQRPHYKLDMGSLHFTTCSAVLTCRGYIGTYNVFHCFPILPGENMFVASNHRGILTYVLCCLSPLLLVMPCVQYLMLPWHSQEKGACWHTKTYVSKFNCYCSDWAYIYELNMQSCDFFSTVQDNIQSLCLALNACLQLYSGIS